METLMKEINALLEDKNTTITLLHMSERHNIERGENN